MSMIPLHHSSTCATIADRAETQQNDEDNSGVIRQRRPVLACVAEAVVDAAACSSCTPSDLIDAALSLPLACLILLVRRNNAAHSCMCGQIHPSHFQCETSLQVPWWDKDLHCIAQKPPSTLSTALCAIVS
jgi:hypothetical protein